MNREEGPLVTRLAVAGAKAESGDLLQIRREERAGQSVGVCRDGDIGNKYAVTVIYHKWAQTPQQCIEEKVSRETMCKCFQRTNR